jgi:flagellar biosynthesis/type III secretory pathway protein FliH
MQAEQYLQIRVHPDALKRVEGDIEAMREMHPAVTQFQIIADSELDRFGCVLISESGKIEAGLDEQIESLRLTLRKAAAAMTEIA